MFVPALLISLNNAVAAPRWASWPEVTGEGACTGGGGGGAGFGAGGAADGAPAFATAPCRDKYCLCHQRLLCHLIFHIVPIKLLASLLQA